MRCTPGARALWSNYRMPLLEPRHRIWLVTLMQYGLGFFDHEGGRVDQRQGCLPSARSPRRFLPRSCGVERWASGLGSIINSVICAVSRGKLQWIPVPADPTEGQHDDEHRRVGRYLFCAAVGPSVPAKLQDWALFAPW